MTIHYIDITSITVGERHRKMFAARPLAELKRSILLPVGLLHPVVVREIGENHYELVVGERRLRAISEIAADEHTFYFAGLEVGIGMIPAIIADPNLTDADIREAELDENIRREDLVWQERVAAIAELHELRKTQNPSQTYADTSREITPPIDSLDPDDLPHPETITRQSATRIANAELIAQHLDDEDVANAQSEREALRIVTQKIERQFALATIHTMPKSPHTLHHEDFRNVPWEDDRGKFNTVITDPPYGIGVKSFGDAAKLRHEYTEDDYMTLHRDLINILYTVCAEDAHVYLFCDIDHFHQIAEMFRNVDKFSMPWRVRRAPLIWSKGNSGHLSEGDVYGFRRSYEFILHARRGDKSHKELINDIIHVPPARNKYHAAEKPVELYTILMRMSTYPGEQVLDPFAGSGPIFPAATALSCLATGCEISDKYVEYIEATYNLRRTEDATQEGKVPKDGQP